MSHVPVPVKMSPVALIAIVLGSVGQTPVWLTVILAVLGSVAVVAAALITTRGKATSIDEKLGRLEQKLDDHMSNHGAGGMVAHTVDDPVVGKVASADH